MASVAGGVTSAGTVIVKEAYNCFKPHFDYVYDLDENSKRLEKASIDLSAVKDDTQKRTSQHGNAKVMTNQCRNWFRKVETTQEEIRDLQQRHKEANKYLCGMCPFLKLRKLGKSIINTTKDAVDLKTEMNKLREIMTPQSLQRDVTDIVELNSLTNNVRRLLNLLGQKDLKMIGIYGIEGVGKTTLLGKLYAEADQNRRFDIAILVSYQEEDSVREMQKDLLRQLKLSVNGNDSTKKVGDRISEKLEDKKYLLLLDQVSSCIDLHEVGILRDCHMYGKVVFASSKKSICNKMKADTNFRVDFLPREDIRVLFLTLVGGVITNIQIKKIAENIAKELMGLPLAIKAMAGNLKHEDHVHPWQHVLWTLQRTTDGPQQHLQEVYDIFAPLHDQLCVEMKRCLLYAALFPGGYEIYDDYLVEGWKVQGLFQRGNDQTFQYARHQGNYFLLHLTESCFLERCSKEKYFKMRELVRKVVYRLHPAEVERQIVVEACTTENEWRDARRIALMHNIQLSLPKKPKCRKLSTLLLQRNDGLKSIQNSFFAHMKKLQILYLYHTGIELLPPSLFSLINLKALYLNDCRGLAVLSSKIAKLRNLEILDIRDTGILSLPIEIGKLKNLKCFRVSFPCNDAIADSPKNSNKPRVMIPPNLIKKLHQLEELTIIVDPNDQSWKGIADNIAEEVASLKQLTIRCLPGQASPSVYGTPSEGSPSVNGHGIISSQPRDCDYDIPLASLNHNHNHNHNNGEIQEASSSNSMTAAARVYQTRQVQSSSYIDAFPQCIRPYIKHVKDVSPDGHCGFRSIAGLIRRGEDRWVDVRNDLLQELHTYNDLYTNLYGSFERIGELTHSLTYFDAKVERTEYWMTMPDMGHLIASCYNIVLYHFSTQQCLTFLPLRSDPLPLLDRKEISIGFVNGNHFVELFMEQGHPVPPIASNWQKYRYNCAAGWESPYDKRITRFKEIVNENVVTKETFEAVDID